MSFKTKLDFYKNETDFLSQLLTDEDRIEALELAQNVRDQVNGKKCSVILFALMMLVALTEEQAKQNKITLH